MVGLPRCSAPGTRQGQALHHYNVSEGCVYRILSLGPVPQSESRHQAYTTARNDVHRMPLMEIRPCRTATTGKVSESILGQYVLLLPVDPAILGASRRGIKFHFLL